MKRIICLISALLLIAAIFSPAAFAAEGSYNTQYVVDNADLFSSEEEANLQILATAIDNQYDCSVVFLTTEDLGSYNTKMELADDYYDYNNYKKDGVLVLLTMEDENNKRGIWTTTTGNCQKKFSTSEQDAVYEDVYNDLANGNYYEAMAGYANGINYYLAPHVSFTSLLIALGVGFGIALIIALIFKSQLKSVAMQHGAKNYVRPGSMQVTASRDTFLYSTVNRTAKPKNNSSGGSHIGSSGTSHGGSGHSF